MSIERIWQYCCDHCQAKTTAREVDGLPGGWSALSYFGDIKHACPKCRTWAEQHAKDTSMRIRPEIQKA